MNLTKRLEALEMKMAEETKKAPPNLIILRKLVAVDTKDEPMNYAKCEGELFERRTEETEDEFGERIHQAAIAKRGPEKVYMAVMSVDRRDPL